MMVVQQQQKCPRSLDAAGKLQSGPDEQPHHHPFIRYFSIPGGRGGLGILVGIEEKESPGKGQPGSYFGHRLGP
jgi:hypothetical protein